MGAATAGFAPGAEGWEQSAHCQLTWQSNAQPPTLPAASLVFAPCKLQLQRGAEVWVWSRAGGEEGALPHQRLQSRCEQSTRQPQHGRTGCRSDLRIFITVSLEGASALLQSWFVPSPVPAGAQGDVGCWQDCTSTFLLGKFKLQSPPSCGATGLEEQMQSSAAT